MDVEWCIMCDNKIYSNDHSETYSAYCSTHCFLTAHLEASQSQNQSTSQSQSQSTTQSSSSKPTTEPKKQTNQYPITGNQYTIKQSSPMNSAGSSNLNLNGNLRIDSIYPIHHTHSIGLEESLSNQFLLKPHKPSQYILSSVYSDDSSISPTNDEDLLNDHHDRRGRGRSSDRRGLASNHHHHHTQKIWLGEPNFLKR